MKAAPDFSLPDQDENIRSLVDYKGKWVVLYFYPKDDTPGCTTEACNFRDEREAIKQFGNTEVIGVSMDSPRSHKKFIEKYNLNFTLLSDPDHSVIETYGSWQPKKLFGKEFMGIVRSTYIIDPNNNIVKSYPKVDAKQHAAEIIRDLRKLQAEN